MNLLGIDACKAGWVIASSSDRLATIQFEVQRDLRNVFEQVRRREILAAIDIPIGLTSKAPRLCDTGARKQLGPLRQGSVFPPPSRAVLAGATWEQAGQLSRQECGKGITKQSHGIFPKIREIDALIKPDLQTSIRETLPEVVFAVLGGKDGAPRLGKKKKEGHLERIVLLRRFVPQIDVAFVHDARVNLLRNGGFESRAVSRDDVMDAVACLLVAHCIHLGQAISIPDDPEIDDHGLRMEIVIPSLLRIGAAFI